MHERKQRSVSESTWNSSNGEIDESAGDTAVSRTSTLTSMQGGFAAAAGPVSEQQKEGQQVESLAGTAGNTASAAEKAIEEVGLRSEKSGVPYESKLIAIADRSRR